MTALYLVKATRPDAAVPRRAGRWSTSCSTVRTARLVVEEFVVPTKTRAGSDEPAPSTATDDAAKASDRRRDRERGAEPAVHDRKRIVVVRDFEQLNAEEAGPIAAVLGDPLDTTVFVFVGGGGRARKSPRRRAQGREGRRP